VKHRTILGMAALLVLLMAVFLVSGCGQIAPTTNDGVKKADVTVTTQSNGLTVEQENIQKRLLNDNRPGSIKHLYVFSGMSGQCLLYSTVVGKVTSSGKRLTPYEAATTGQYNNPAFSVNGFATNEVMEDDGTYGSSVPYIYWWDSKGVYHQHFMTTGDQIVHISDQPMDVKNIIVTIDGGE
jgi:hypothetical protein